MQQICAGERARSLRIGQIRAQPGEIVAEDIPHRARCDVYGAVCGVIQDSRAAAASVPNHERHLTLRHVIGELHPENVAGANAGD